MEEQKISPSQLMMLIFVSVFSFVVMTPATGGISLMSVIAAVIVVIPLLLLMVLPATVYSRIKKNTAGFFYANKIISILYGIFFLYIFSYSIYLLCGFCEDIAGDDINRYIICVGLAAGALFAASRGIEAAARFSLVTLVLVIISSVIFTYYTYSSFNPSVFSDFRQSANDDLINNIFRCFSFLPALAAIMLYGGNTFSRSAKGVLLAIILGGIFLTFILILICGTSGIYLLNTDYPFFHAIDSAGELQRFDPIFIAVTVCCTFCSMSLDVTAASDSLHRVFPGKRHGLIFAIIAAAVSILGLWSYNSGFGKVVFAAPVITVLTIAFFFFVPLIILTLSFFLSHADKKTKKIKKCVAGIMCLIVIICMLCGCTSVQLNQKLIIQGVSIDKTDSGYYLSCIILDTKNEKDDNEVKYVCAEGESVRKALNHLEISLGSRVMLSQCLFILLSESAADVPDESLGYFENNKEIMKNVSLLVTDGNAAFLLKKAVTELGYTCERINMLTSSKAVKQHTENYTIFDYITDKNSGITDYNMPRILLNMKTGLLEAI